MIDWDRRMDRVSPPTERVAGSADGRGGRPGLIAIASGATGSALTGGAQWMTYASDAPDGTIDPFVSAVAAGADTGMLSHTLRCFVAETTHEIVHPEVDIEVTRMDQLSRGLIETVIAHSRGIVLPTPDHPQPVPLVEAARGGPAVVAPPDRIDGAIRPHLRGVFADVEDATCLERAIRVVISGDIGFEVDDTADASARSRDDRPDVIDMQRHPKQ